MHKYFHKTLIEIKDYAIKLLVIKLLNILKYGTIHQILNID